MLARQRESLWAQSCWDWMQILLPDEKGVGCAEANKSLREVKAAGDYVWVFDDDDIITDVDFVARVKEASEGGKIEVVVAPSMYNSERIIGAEWPPREGHIGNINWIMRQDVWDLNRKFWGARYAGDFDLIEACMRDVKHIAQLKRVMLATQRVSKGATECESVTRFSS